MEYLQAFQTSALNPAGKTDKNEIQSLQLKRFNVTKNNKYLRDNEDING
jgi:hypothetical protein